MPGSRDIGLMQNGGSHGGRCVYLPELHFVILHFDTGTVPVHHRVPEMSVLCVSGGLQRSHVYHLKLPTGTLHSDVGTLPVHHQVLEI